MKWFEQGEKPTKYFFTDLEKMNYEKKLIREVKLKDGETITQIPNRLRKNSKIFMAICIHPKKILIATH